MLRIRGVARGFCDGLHRRDFMRLGDLGSLRLCLTLLLQPSATPSQPRKRTFGKARRCLLLFLTGGPPQHDTWDLKPNAPERIRGELKPIATSVPGLRISELFPRLAKLTHHLCIVRSVTHGDR